MSQPMIPNNLSIANPTLMDVLQAQKTDTMMSTNCHGVGTVQSVAINTSNGLLTATATMDYNRTYYIRQPDGSYQATTQEYPLLVDCPVVVLGGGAAALNTPIKKGDRCLILFNDRDLNNWFAGARSGPVATTRLHSFADAFILVGFQTLSSFDTTRMVITDGNAKVGIDTANHKAVITNQTNSLYTCLANLITAIEGITVNPGSFTTTGGPVTGVSGTVHDTSALEAAKTALGNLLE